MMNRFNKYNNSRTNNSEGIDSQSFSISDYFGTTNDNKWKYSQCNQDNCHKHAKQKAFNNGCHSHLCTNDTYSNSNGSISSRRSAYSNRAFQALRNNNGQKNMKGK